MTINSAFDAWKHRAATTPIATAAEKLGLKLVCVQGRKNKPVELAGPCPNCGGNDRFAINTKKNVFGCMRGHCGGSGHGAIDLAMFAAKVGFLAACELLTGEPPPARDSQVTDADRKRWQEEARAAAEDKAKREADENVFRERTRGWLNVMWKRALPIAGTPAEGYIKLRGLRVPDTMRLRCILDMPFYSGEGDHGDILARAPALILPIVDAAGIFRGLHLTYINLDEPKGRLVVRDAAGNVLLDKHGKPYKTKKTRGSVLGNKVEILRCENPGRLVMGEGFEKTAAVWMALADRGDDLSATACWSACNLGNLGGRSAGRGRASLPDPDPDDPGIPIPDSVTDLILLGDTTSDPFTTRCAMYRAQQRYARPGRTVRLAWAPEPGHAVEVARMPEPMDFDDVWRRAA